MLGWITFLTHLITRKTEPGPGTLAAQRWLDQPVSLEVKDLSVRELLDALCRDLSCGWGVDRDGRIIVVPVPDGRSKRQSAEDAQ